MLEQAKVLVPVGLAGFAGAAIGAAFTDGRSLPVRIIVGAVTTTLVVAVASHFGLIKLGAAAKAAAPAK